MAGHFTFGGRTGGSVIIDGPISLVLRLCFGTGFDHIVGAFPLPILGVLLLFEALALIWMGRATATFPREFPIVILVGLLATGLPYGYIVAVVVGTAIERLGARGRLVNP